jgi:hypothetical protein
MPPLALKQLPRQAMQRARQRIGRQTELDWLRGLMLVLMTITHLPTWFSSHVGQPFGFVSAAEGFVFLSAYLVGSVYTGTAVRHGYTAMRHAIWRRAAKVYAAQVALLLLLFWILVPFALSQGAHAITDLASFYIEHPRAGLVAALFLAYNPPLLDILPMYVVFMLVSPALLQHGSRHGWGALLGLSAAMWLLAQHDGGRDIYAWLTGVTGWPIPYNQTGAFSFLAWQLLWVAGLRAGALHAQAAVAGEPRTPYSRLVLWTAMALAIAFFAWRHITGQVPFGEHAALNALFDKWHLGPMRLLNFAVLAVLVVHGRQLLVALAERSSIATLGRASLTVFAAHLVLCLVLLATGGGALDPQHVSLLDGALLAGTLVTLYAIARATLNGGKLLAKWSPTPRPKAPADVNVRAVR